MCIFDSSNAKPEIPLMDILYWSQFRMWVIGRCVLTDGLNCLTVNYYTYVDIQKFNIKYLVMYKVQMHTGAIS